MNLGPIELGAIALIAVLVFGTRLPKVARSLGQAQKEFKKGVKEGAVEDSAKSDDAPKAD